MPAFGGEMGGSGPLGSNSRVEQTLSSTSPMDPIGAGASLAGGILNFMGQSQTNAQNREIAREQMAFQERMSSTSYQRAMQDMQSAGLNPMLAFQQGGASSPSGASLEMQNPLAGNMLQSAVSTALEASRIKADIAETQSRTRMNEANLPRMEARAKIEKKYGEYLAPADAVLERLDSLGGGLMGSVVRAIGKKGSTQTNGKTPKQGKIEPMGSRQLNSIRR